MTAQTSVTLLGLGPMGSALSRAFLEAGHPTTVWNRTPGKAEALVANGATEAATATEAINASELVIVCVIDYDAVHSIIEPAADVLRGRTLVNLTADTPARARTTAAWAEKQGIHYLDGAIMSPTPTIGGQDAVVLYSGPREHYEAHQRGLASIGGTVTHLGVDPGRAAGYDIALLDLFWTSMNGLVHAYALARAEGIDGKDFAPLAQGILSILPPVTDEFATNVDTDTHPGDESTIKSAAATFEHILHAAEEHGIDGGPLTVAQKYARRAMEGGHGAESYSRIVDTLRPRDA